MTYKEFKAKFKKTQPELFKTKNIPETFIKYIFEKISSIMKDLNIKEITDAHDVFTCAHLSGHSYSRVWDEFIVHGSGDGAIDSFYLQNNELFLIQTKFAKIKRNELNAMKDTYSKYIIGSSPLLGQYKDLKILKDFYIKNKSDIKKVRYVGASPYDTNYNIDDIDSYSWRKIMVESVSNLKKSLEIVIQEYSKNANEPETLVDKETYFVKMRGDKFIDQILKYNPTSQESLFEQNVRDFVVDNKFKKAFKDTIDEEPDKFEFYNNGLTIIVDECTRSVGDDITLVNPQIINGQQTTRILIALSQGREKVDLSKIMIYAKIIEVQNNDELIMKIAKYSNNQKSIKEGDLISATTGFKALNKLALDNNLYIIAKEGKSDKKNFYKKIKYKAINITELIKMDVVINRRWLIPKAKNMIGTVKADYIKNGWLGEIDKKALLNLYKQINKKKEIAKKMRIANKANLNEEDSKIANKIIGFTDLYINYAVAVKKDPYTKILELINDYQMADEDDSMINHFKVWKGYEKLGIKKVEDPNKKDKINEA